MEDNIICLHIIIYLHIIICLHIIIILNSLGRQPISLWVLVKICFKYIIIILINMMPLGNMDNIPWVVIKCIIFWNNIIGKLNIHSWLWFRNCLWGFIRNNLNRVHSWNINFLRLYVEIWDRLWFRLWYRLWLRLWYKLWFRLISLNILDRLIIWNRTNFYWSLGSLGSLGCLWFINNYWYLGYLRLNICLWIDPWYWFGLLIIHYRIMEYLKNNNVLI